MENQRRIGVLFMQSQEFFGADSQIHASIMRHLSRDRFDVHCAVPKDRDGAPAPSTERLRTVSQLTLRPTDFGTSLEGRRWSALIRMVPAVWSLLGLAWYVRRHRLTIVHCTEKPRDAIYGTAVAFLGGARCIIHVHVKAETWIRSGVRKAMRRAAALIGVSEFVAETIRDLGYEASRVHAVLNGLELDEWEDPTTDVADVRSEFGIGADAPLLVSAARLFRYKGQHDMLAALPAVKERFPAVRVLIVGKDDQRGYQGEQSYSDVLRGMCTELGLWDNVVFAGWRSDVKDLMAASDMYVMPSFEEPFGMVFIESMYLRRPVVALDNGGTREVVDNGGSGLLSAPGDVDAIARNIVRLLDDRELRLQMGEHGRQRVVELLNAERMTRDVEHVYESVAAPKRTRRSKASGDPSSSATPQ